MAGSEAVVEIRQLFQLAEFADVLRLQQVIWGFADVELLPLRFLVVVSKVGGHVFGAYDGAELVGFCFAIPGVKPGARPYLHSHMLGVLPAYHNAGIGRRLKLRQREDALERGIELIEWTFDPLELKNAFLNIERSYLWTTSVALIFRATGNPRTLAIITASGAVEAATVRLTGMP